MVISDLKAYFSTPQQFHDAYEPSELGHLILSFENFWMQPSLESIQIALLGVDETRDSVHTFDNSNCADAIRKQLFKLKFHSTKIRIADLGNLRRGITSEDTRSAISVICAELIKQQIIPIIIGGSQDITFAQYHAYKQLAQIINIANIDSSFDLGESSDQLKSNSFLGKIILEQPNYLFNYSHIGHQIYFVGDNAVEKMNKLFFDTYRLGRVREDILEMEPVLRNSDLLTVDLSAVRYADCTGTTHPSPNGFYAEEICQLMYYSGISEKISSLGLYEIDIASDNNYQTSQLVSQMIWYFIEGYSKRKFEQPAYNKNGYLKYTVTLGTADYEIIFLKSQKTDRWWMEIPVLDNYTKFQRHHIVPCSYKDYQQALNNEMPERWWQTFKKLA